MKMTAARAKKTIDAHNANYHEWHALEVEAGIMANEIKLAEYEWYKAKFPKSFYTYRKETFDYLTTDGEDVTVHTEDYVSGDTDYNEWTFPIWYFDDPDWKQKHIKAKEEAYAAQLIQSAKDKEAQGKKATEAAKERRKQVYEELRKEFE